MPMQDSFLCGHFAYFRDICYTNQVSKIVENEVAKNEVQS